MVTWELVQLNRNGFRANPNGTGISGLVDEKAFFKPGRGASSPEVGGRGLDVDPEGMLGRGITTQYMEVMFIPAPIYLCRCLVPGIYLLFGVFCFVFRVFFLCLVLRIFFRVFCGSYFFVLRRGLIVARKACSWARYHATVLLPTPPLFMPRVLGVTCVCFSFFVFCLVVCALFLLCFVLFFGVFLMFFFVIACFFVVCVFLLRVTCYVCCVTGTCFVFTTRSSVLCVCFVFVFCVCVLCFCFSPQCCCSVSPLRKSVTNQTVQKPARRMG